MIDFITHTVQEELEERFKHAMTKKKYDVNNVDAAREYVQAELGFVLYSHGLYTTITGRGEHEEEAKKGHEHQRFRYTWNKTCSISLFDTCFSATDSISLHKYPRIVCTKLASYDPLTSLKPEPAGHCLAGTSRAWFGTRGVHTFPPFRRVLPLSGGN